MADVIFEAVVEHNTAGGNDEAIGARDRLLAMAKGQGIDAAIRGKSELKNGVIASVLAAMQDPEAWHVPNGERAPVMAAGLRVACAFMEQHLGSVVGPEWAWGKLHVCHFTNQGAGQLGDFLNAPPFASGGNSDTIAQVTIGNISGGQVPSQDPPGTASYRCAPV